MYHKFSFLSILITNFWRLQCLWTGGKIIQVLGWHWRRCLNKILLPYTFLIYCWLLLGILKHHTDWGFFFTWKLWIYLKILLLKKNCKTTHQDFQRGKTIVSLLSKVNGKYYVEICFVDWWKKKSRECCPNLEDTVLGRNHTAISIGLKKIY